MRYYKRFKLIISVAMLLFTIGCVKQENKSDESYDLLSSDMWKTDGFVTDDEVVKEQELWIDRYIRWEHDDVELLSDDERALETIEGDALQDCIYRFTPVNTLSEFTTVRVLPYSVVQ